MAREVGIEGKLGGQARVPGAAGLWRDLTDNVNQLAANLTNQVRSIADVATAVTKGDLTRSIAVEASGEMAALKDNINEMIRNLKEQTLKNAEQDWLKTNLARFSRMLQGERDLATVSNLIMSELAPLVNAQYGVFYVTKREEEETRLELVASYGAESHDELSREFNLREGLVGQAAADKRPILLEDVPGDFIRIGSGLGHAAPANINILPALFEDDVKAVIELASFSEFNETHQSFLDQLMESIGIVLNTIAATMRTEGLLKQSQLLTQELQARQTELTTKQEELHATNEELQEKAQLLENEKKQVEAKNLEIDMARRAVEEKAEQLALTSKYKSEFLANMSHELRTPLNSLLILSKLLADNPQGNLNEKQTEFARTINSAGSDLLNLINDILDLSKIESGTVSIELGDMPMTSLKQHMERTFRQLAADKGLDVQRRVRRESARRDPHRREAAAAGRAQPAVQRLQVHRARRRHPGGALRRQRLEHQPSGAAQRRPGDRDRGHRHRHRHSRGQAEADLRGVPAGRRHHQPQIWRHRPRPLDQPRDRPPARRRAAGPLEARRGLDLHPVRAARGGGDRRAGSATTTARYENSGAAGPVRAAGDARGQRRPRQSRRRSVRADRRGRRHLRLDPARSRAGRPGSRAWSRPPARARWRWRASCSPTRSRSISASTTSTASCCSTCSSTMPRPAEIPIHVISGADEAAIGRGTRRLRRHREAGRPRRAGQDCSGGSTPRRRPGASGRPRAQRRGHAQSRGPCPSWPAPRS